MRSHPSGYRNDDVLAQSPDQHTSLPEKRPDPIGALITRVPFSQAQTQIPLLDQSVRRSRTALRTPAIGWDGKVIQEGDLVTVMVADWSIGTKAWMLNSFGVVVAVHRVRTSVRFSDRIGIFHVPTRVLAAADPLDYDPQSTPA
jgi:hypothetical protein